MNLPAIALRTTHAVEGCGPGALVPVKATEGMARSSDRPWRPLLTGR